MSEPTPTLNYARPRLIQWHWLWLAKLLGGLPLGIGTIITALYLLEPEQRLVDAGVMTIFAGLLSVGLASVILLSIVITAWQRHLLWRMRWQLALATALVAANLPLGALFLWIASIRR
jgi:hypothetical protein